MEPGRPALPPEQLQQEAVAEGFLVGQIGFLWRGMAAIIDIVLLILNRFAMPSTPNSAGTVALIFSHRELQVLQLLADGLCVEDIAGKLCLSPHTVRNHRKRMMERAGAHNTIHLVAIALRNGCIR